ncbi:MAG: TIGR03087 family PEP-CTERM/XrtA system glycosyltransferase [Pseudomonadota bacterium]
MDDVLFLPQRCPYPPNKGDKIATWNILKHLAKRYRVHLGTYVDDPDDWQHADVLRQTCASVKLIDLDPRTAKIKSLSGFLTGEALSVAYYRQPAMQAWVDEKLASGVKRIFVFSSAMARYVTRAPGCVRIMDFCDLDSDKWRQYAAASAWPMSWVYAREADKLLAWERRIAADFDHSLFISEAETRDFKALAPESAHKVSVLTNGVDAEYFSPEREYPRLDQAAAQLVFTGAMDYKPNIDAVVWFAREVLPLLRQTHPQTGFTVVGSKPSAEVQDLAREPGIHVTGRVEDVRPYLAHAAGVVAPLRIARGIQNKVLEGMAMGKTVICSPQALEGIAAQPGQNLLLADTPAAFADACRQVLDGQTNLGEAARRCVLDTYAWDACLARLDTLLEPAA